MRLLITGGSGFIGTNVAQFCIDRSISFVNIDIAKPLNTNHNPFWKSCDILDFPKMLSHFKDYKPTAVLHLAARTDTDIHDLDADISLYRQNTEGTKNVLNCIKAIDSVHRVIITSSMFVCKQGFVPVDDEDVDPFTLYGVSKVLTEKYTREAKLTCTWTIIRPQTIWGPWSIRYQSTMLSIMKKGFYFHPNQPEVYRAYGYIGNVVWQIFSILMAHHEQVSGKTFYVGDEPLNLLEWVNSISKNLIGKKVRLLPTPLVYGLAVYGDMLKLIGIRFPITTTRFDSMVQNYLTSIEKTVDALGPAPYSMEDGVQAFVRWSKQFTISN